MHKDQVKTAREMVEAHQELRFMESEAGWWGVLAIEPPISIYYWPEGSRKTKRGKVLTQPEVSMPTYSDEISPRSATKKKVEEEILQRVGKAPEFVEVVQAVLDKISR